jgi:hypothetical protein
MPTDRERAGVQVHSSGTPTQSGEEDGRPAASARRNSAGLPNYGWTGRARAEGGLRWVRSRVRLRS